MKTKVAAIYGKRDVRLRVFELPEITDNELLVSVISDSVCLSTWKAALLGSEHKRVPDDLENHPVITGHECAGVIVEVGKNLTGKYKKGQRFVLQPAMGLPSGYSALMNPLMILVKIIKLRWIHILSYDQMVSRKINNQTTRCANSIF
ncbi:alcohol dehydrogenase catalytic domain-containing protein, partial [Escherichia coli]|uniref:alcohol dehydrogenase catalytic domain-containing protein n=1 Tax=Escherichia coli TaxID=562 RepID=UPI0034A10A36